MEATVRETLQWNIPVDDWKEVWNWSLGERNVLENVGLGVSVQRWQQKPRDEWNIVEKKT